MLALLLIAILPIDRVYVDRVDRVEINHVYGMGSCGLAFDQVVWWDWSYDNDRYQVVAWRILNNVRLRNEEDDKQWDRDHPDGPPYVAEFIGGHACPRRKGRKWVSEWFDEKARKNRKVIASVFIETWTNVDREMIERREFPEKRRRLLSK